MKKFVFYSLLFIIVSILHSQKPLASEIAKSKAADSFDLSQYEGKVIYLDFWASWCVPCRKSFPWMNQLQQKHEDKDLVIVAINLDKKKSLADAFLLENPANFNIVYDPKGQLAKKFGIKGMPSSVIFDRNGKAVKAHTGFFVKKIDQYEQEIQNTLNIAKK